MKPMGDVKNAPPVREIHLNAMQKHPFFWKKFCTTISGSLSSFWVSGCMVQEELNRRWLGRSS